MLKVLKIAASAAALTVLGDVDANAAGEKFCKTYAGTSVDQFNRSQELELSVSGPRWHGVFDLHKAWCRFVSKAAAQHEINVRRDVIGRAGAATPAGPGTGPPPDYGTAPPSSEPEEGLPPSWSDDEPSPPEYGGGPPPSEYGAAPPPSVPEGGPPPSWSEDEPPPPEYGSEPPPSWSDEEPPPSDYGSEPPPSWAYEGPSP